MILTTLHLNICVRKLEKLIYLTIHNARSETSHKVQEGVGHGQAVKIIFLELVFSTDLRKKTGSSNLFF